MRYVCKVGSSSLTKDDGINKVFIKDLCRQVAFTKKESSEGLIVTSGAVASDPKKHRSKNLRASIGMGLLINDYISEFRKYNIEVSQILVTDRDVLGKTGFFWRILSTLGIGSQALVFKETCEEAFREKCIVPVVNANDPVDSKELKALEYCADNDRLSLLTAILIGADKLVIGFDKPGIIDRQGNILHIAKLSEKEKILSYAEGGSHCGHGKDGMRTKLEVCFEARQKGIDSYLAPTREPDFLLRILAGENNFGTQFVF
jgi:glutamate 5-kinase